jgi:polyisoprenoid-binding protein YceI
MNRKLSVTYLILIIAPLVFGCRGSLKEKDKNNVSASSLSPGQKYIIDTAESVVTWKGSMLFGFEEEFIGNVFISKGELMIEENQLVGGTVEINMNTIEFKDKKRPDGPVKHLKSPDLFDVKKFPISTFALTKVASVRGETLKITGNLTIKGMTNPVTFPAKIEVKDGIAEMNAKLVIDRTDWGIRYRSGKFYDKLGDLTISDEIEFRMKIVAKK